MAEENKEVLEKKDALNVDEKEEALEDISDDIPEEVHEILQKVEPKERKIIERTMTIMGMQRSIMQPESEISKKLTDQHITEYLEASREDMRNSYKDKNYQRIFIVVLLIIAIIFMVLIIQLLKDKPDTMENILCSLGGAVFGAIGGYGFGTRKKDD